MFVEAKDGTRLFVRDWGKGEPLLFVASQSVPSDIWSHTIAFFVDAGYRCVSFDRRGHGRSDEADEGYDIDTLAGDVGSVIERLALSNVSIVGHSLGGAEVIRYVAHSGAERVKKTVLLAPTAPFMTKTADNPDGIDRGLIEATWASWRKDFPGWVRENARPFFGVDTSDAMTDWCVGLMTKMSLFVQLAVARVSAETDLRGDLPRIATPTLHLHGEKDVSVPVAFGRLTAQSIPKCRFKSYATAAHGLFITHADEVNADILAFLRG
jgi:pimeloyl-ACP methyl ester carboxylesterase